MPEPRTVALRLLGRRDYSVAELTERLLKRGFDGEAVDAAVAALVAAGIVDDRRTAEGHVRQSSRLKGRGAWRIRRELQARGIAEDLASDALAALSPDEERLTVRRLLARHPPPDSPMARRRLFQRLVRRGFSPSLVAQELQGEVDDS